MLTTAYDNHGLTRETTRTLLDAARGVLVSLSNRGDAFFHPTSTLAIRAGLERRNLDVAPADLLQHLYSIGDVQRLDHGYWLPVATAAVDTGDICIVVSGFPTSTLETQLGCSLSGDGYSRLVERPRTEGLPSRLFLHWSQTPASTLEWTRQFINSEAFTHYFVGEDFEYFTHWSSSLRWIANASHTRIPDGVVLARTKVHLGYDYLLGRFVDGDVVEIHELDRGWDIACRLGWGLRSIHGHRGRFQLRRSDSDRMQITLTRFIPPEEATVFAAIGSIEFTDETTLAVTFKAPLVPRVTHMLNALGMDQDT